MIKKKVLKYIKYSVVIWLSLTILIFIGGVVKYHIDLNRYINQEEPNKVMATNDSSSHGTEVHILGTVHFETEQIKRDNFYRYLDSVSPDIILYESDKQTVKRMINRTDFFWQLMSSFKKANKVESFVVHKYVKHNPESKVIGFEWEDRDRFHFKHNYRKNMSKLLGTAIKLNKENLLSNEESEIMNEYFTVNKKYYNLGNSKTLYDFNNPIADSIIKVRQEYVYNKIPQILKTKELSDELREFLPVHMSYWDTRNLTMVNNIINHIKNNPNKRIAILTGYSHRYYLIDELKKLEEEFNFSVKPI